MDYYGDQNFKPTLPNLLSKHTDTSLSAWNFPPYTPLVIWTIPLIHWKDCSFHSRDAGAVFIRATGLRQISNTVILSAHNGKTQRSLHY